MSQDSNVSKSEWNMTRWRIEDIAQNLRAITRFRYILKAGDKSVLRDYYAVIDSLFWNLQTLMDEDSVVKKREELKEIEDDIKSTLEGDIPAERKEAEEIQEKLEDMDMELRQIMKQANLDFKQKKEIEEGKEILEGIFE